LLGGALNRTITLTAPPDFGISGDILDAACIFATANNVNSNNLFISTFLLKSS
jgi:hypothetical protein